MRRTLLFLVVVLAAVAACERRRAPDPRPMVAKALHGMFVYPQSTPVDMAAGENAAQLTLTTMDPAGRVADWFRAALKLNGWTLQSDFTGRDSSITIAATKESHPVWITLRPNVGGPGTTYTVIGAVVATGDSQPAKDSLR